MTRPTKVSKKPKKKPSPARIRARICAWLICLTLLFGALSFGVYKLQAKLIAERESGIQDTEVIEGTFGVKSITVEGNDHYSSDQIINASGLFIGKNIWKINRSAAANSIKNSCPYVENVHISTKLLNQVTITVDETHIAGAVYSKEKWVLVGANGQAVDSMDAISDIPLRYMHIKGVKPLNKGLGKQALSDYDLSVYKQIIEALEKYKIENVNELDMTNSAAITINWNNQIKINLGNSTNIDHEMAVIKQTLDQILAKHGKLIRGELDVSSYSNAELTNQAIFTPTS